MSVMGIDVQVVLTFASSPNETMIGALDHQFESVRHEPGSKTVVVTEHVSVTNEADAVEFVRALVLDAVPPGAKIAEITSTPD